MFSIFRRRISPKATTQPAPGPPSHRQKQLTRGRRSSSKTKLFPQSEYEQAKLNYQNAKTAQEAVANKTTAKGTGVGAPIGGFIKNIAVSEGQFVEVGQLLATISQEPQAEAQSRSFATLSRCTTDHLESNFKTSYDDKTYSLKDLGGRLVSVGKASDGASAYIPVTFEFDNKGGIVSGSFVEVFPDLITQTEHADRSGHGADRRTGAITRFSSRSTRMDIANRK
ncbi:MAG: biotin/lipoyl-binding protein [Alistipes indistinctus]